MSSTVSVGSLDHYQLTPSEQLCYVHCHLCDTVLAVSVPSSSLYKTVTVRCGHCASLLPVNMRGIATPPPPANSHLHLTNHHPFSPSPSSNLEVNMSPTPNMSPSLSGSFANNYVNSSSSSNRAVTTDLPKPSAINRPPEKRQRVPSAYNRFIKDEIQRIKAGNPDISHREAFSAAAKNWAHFPHIRFGLMPDQTAKRTTNIRTLPNPQPQEAGEDGRMRNGYFGGSARIGVSPY